MEQENLNSEEVNSSSEETTSNDVQISEPVTEIVAEAKKTGHLSKEQYIQKYGSEEGYKSEEDFVKYGRAYEDLKPIINSLHKKLDDREKEIKAILSYNERLSQERLDKRKMEIDYQLQQAKEYNNVVDVEKLTIDKIRLEQEEQSSIIQKDLEDKQKVISEFVERNKHWYNPQYPELMNKVLQVEKEISYDYAVRRLPLSYDQLANLIEKRMEAEHSEIVNKPLPKPLPILNSQQSSKPLSQSFDKTFNSLSDELKGVYKALSRNNSSYWTKERYLNKLKQDGEI